MYDKDKSYDRVGEIYVAHVRDRWWDERDEQTNIGMSQQDEWLRWLRAQNHSFYTTQSAT